MLEKISICHISCGHHFTRIASKTTPKVYCPECYPSHRSKRSQKDFEKEVIELTKGEYKVVGKYINVDSKIDILHILCGNAWYVKANSFLNGTRCPKCAKGGVLMSEMEFQNRLKKIDDYNEYQFLSAYISYDTKLPIIHKNCGTIYDVSPNKFFYGRRCPYCRESKGEKKISNFLYKNNIDFYREKEFKDLRYRYPLRFDFYIESNGYNSFLIEFDGRQHFEPVKWHKKMSNDEVISSFNEIKLKDNLKNEFAEKHNIPLYRIKYTQFDDIEFILRDILLKERSTTIESITVKSSD